MKLDDFIIAFLSANEMLMKLIGDSHMSASH